MSESEPVHELRDAPRRPFTVDLKVTWKGGKFTCSTVDLSVTGLFLETEEPVPLGTPIHFEGILEAGDDRWYLAGVGEVMRGVRVGDLDEDTPVPGLGVKVIEFFYGEAELTRNLIEAAEEARGDEPGGEGRRAPRILVGMPVRWGPTWPPDREGYLSNVSSTGALVLTAGEPLEPGAAIHLSAELPVGREVSPMRTLATVTRHQDLAVFDGKGMGVEFVPDSPADRTFRSAMGGGTTDDVPSAAAWAVGRPAMDFSAMPAPRDSAEPGRLQALSETVQGGGGFRWGTVARIVGIALLVGALLWIGLVCMDPFAG